MSPAGPMRVRAPKRWVLALLPALLLRALLPAGFMPATGSLALVFCEPGVFAASQALHQHHDSMGGTGHSATSECPFAQAAAPALPTLAMAPPVHPLVAHERTALPDRSPPPSIPFRHAAPRGPPAVA